MKFSQPLVLLLGGLLSVSGVGCSAIKAIVADTRPTNRESRSDADRIAAIGRVFENQGRYDKAEAMYRRAIKDRPQDSELRNQLQQLAERRKEQSFGPSGTANAIAVADIVSPPKPRVRSAGIHTATSSATTIAAKTSPERDSNEIVNPIPETVEQAFPERQVSTSSNSVKTKTIVASAELAATLAPDIELTSAKPDGWRKRREHLISSDDVLIALESPDQHVELLLNALSDGDSDETRALAATLLGDCDPANTQIRNVLHQYQQSEQAPEVLLAICDSQIERWEADGQTLSGLFRLCSDGNSETQLQAASQLRNFAGSEFEPSCLAALNQLLSSGDPNVRATAALTLGDFASLDKSTISRLQNLAGNDASSNVRDAADSALGRQPASRLQSVPVLRPSVHY